METPVCTTPREAAYRDASLILAQLRGRSRRAQRLMLERELVRALERAYVFELRDRRLAPKSPVAIEQLRQEVVGLVARCRHLAELCERLINASECRTSGQCDSAGNDRTEPGEAIAITQRSHAIAEPREPRQ